MRKRIVLLGLAICLTGCGAKETEVVEAVSQDVNVEASDLVVIDEVDTEEIDDEKKAFELEGEWVCHNNNGEKTYFIFNDNGKGDFKNDTTTIRDYVSWTYDDDTQKLDIEYLQYGVVYKFDVVNVDDEYYYIVDPKDDTFFVVKEDNYDDVYAKLVGEKESFNSVAVGDVIETDLMSCSIEKAVIADEINWGKRWPVADEGKKFACMHASVKNISKSQISLYGIAGKVIVDGYEYELESFVVDDAGYDATKPEPMCTVNMDLYAQIPDEVIDDCESCIIQFCFNDGMDLTYSMDRILEYDNKYEIVIK